MGIHGDEFDIVFLNKSLMLQYNETYTEKAVNCLRVSSDIDTFCLFNCFDCIRLYYKKTRKLQYTANGVNLSVFTCSCGYIMTSITVFYPFHKINSSRHNNIMAFEVRYYNANS